MSNKIYVLISKEAGKKEDILIVKNSTIDMACLSTKKLHLSRKSIYKLALNVINDFANI